MVFLIKRGGILNLKAIPISKKAPHLGRPRTNSFTADQFQSAKSLVNSFQ